MGYLFLSLALSVGLIKGYCGKRTSYAITRTRDAITITTVRMLLCCVIGFILPLISGASLAITEPRLLFIAIAGGLCSAGFVSCWLLAVRNSMYMMVEVFVAGGVIIPLVFCNILYGEPIGIVDAICVVLILVGVYLISATGKGEKGKWTFKGIALLLITMLFCGASSLTQKMYANEFPEANALVYNFYVYVFAAAALLIVSLALTIKDREPLRISLGVIKPIWLYVVIMAACLFLNSYFNTLAASHLAAVVLYPVSQGLAMILSLVMAVVIFKEKITPRAGVGIALTLAAIVLLNINF